MGIDGASMTELWDRQFNESRKAYAAFCAYRDLGPQRSLPLAYEHRTGKVGARPGRWTHWSQVWHWPSRAEAWDTHQEALKREAEERAMMAHAEKVVADRLALQDTTVDLAKRLIQQAIQMIEWPIAERTINNEDGVTIVKPARWSKGDIPRMIEVADKILRLSLGLETERFGIQMDAVVREAVTEMAKERGLDLTEVMAEVDAIHNRS